MRSSRDVLERGHQIAHAQHVVAQAGLDLAQRNGARGQCRRRGRRGDGGASCGRRQPGPGQQQLADDVAHLISWRRVTLTA
jgi:hypothetical protein